MLNATDANTIAVKTRSNTLENALKHIEFCANQGNFSTRFYTPDYANFLSDNDIRILENLGYKIKVRDAGDWYEISW